MSVQIREDIVGLDEASAELDRLMAADQQAAGGQGSGAETKPDNSANDGGQSGTDGKSDSERAGQARDESTKETKQDQSTESKAGTPAAADKAAADAAGKTAEKARNEKGQFSEKGKADAGSASASRFAKEQQRKQQTWAEVNAQKEALKVERADFVRQKGEFQKMLDESEQEFTPEQFEEAAKQFDEKGNLEMAEAARNKAKQLRQNPDPKAVSRKARMDERKKQTEAQTKEWTLKAGVDFPGLAKNASPLQVRVAELLREDPDFKAHPKGIYVAARIASLEAVAASVPGKDKELAQLRQKVSDLEKATSPGGEGGPTQLPSEKSFEQMSSDEQLGALERQAQELGSIR
jgi:hypothetical protein